jgi:Carboxypeptidase regulatory-like domain
MNRLFLRWIALKWIALEALLFCFLFLLFSAMPAAAQTSTTGSVNGVVTDASSAVLANVTVTLKNTDTGRLQTARTAATGGYQFTFLQPGHYQISTTASGFAVVTKRFEVNVGANIGVNLQLSVSSTQETIEVSGETAGVQTEDANISTTFNAQQVASLPNPGNDLTAVALTSPGVVMNTTGGATFGGGNYEFYGLPSNSNVFTYDGANDNDPYFNVNNSGATNLTLGLNDVQEASVVTNGYSGQYGGLAGANINYLSKSGSNAFHGNAEYFWNGRVLNANRWFNNQANGLQGSQVDPRPFDNANQYATSFGGPIKKDKAFFFVDYEGIRLVIPSPFAVNLPTPAFENAVLANLATADPGAVPLYNTLFGLYNGTPGAVNAQNNLSAGSDPATAGHTGNGCSNISPSTNANFAAFATAPCALILQGGTSQATTDYLIVGRFDMNLTNNDKMFVRVQHEAGLQATYTDPINPAFDAHSAQPEWQSQFSETHTFGPNTVNNFEASLQWYSALFTMVNSAAEFNALPANVGTIAFGDSSLFPLNNDGTAFPQGRDVTQYGVVDDFSRTWGKHTLKAGVNFRRDLVSDHNFTTVIPFQEAFTLADFANGGNTGDLAEQNFPLTTNVPIALYQLGWYLADDVNVTPNLKLTLSMRFDHLSNPTCATNCFQSLAGPFQDLDRGGAVNSVLDTGLHNAFPSVTPVVYEPKIGFAWSPFGLKNTVVRGGFGIFSDAIPTGAIDANLTNAPNDPQFLSFGALPTGGSLSPAGNNSLVGQLAAANAAFVSGFGSGSASVPAFNFFNGSKVVIPRYNEWSLEVQQALGWHSVFSVKYVGNHGSHEEVTNPSENAFSATGFGGLPTTIPDARFAVVGQTGNIGNSNYNGLITTLSHNFNGGFSFNASYTWSHATDDISNSSFNPFGVNTSTNVDVVTPLNPFNLRSLNYSNSDYDVRHSFNMNYVWSDAFRHLTSRGPNALLKGWTFSGTIFKHTGFPFSIYSSGATSDLQSTNFGSTLPATVSAVLANVTGNPGIDCGASGAAIVNGSPTPCYGGIASGFFSAPNPSIAGTFSTQRRNVFRGPGYFDTDFTVEKGFKIPKWEGSSLSVGARFFNFFNHPNFGFPNADVDSSGFGQITSMVSQPTTILGSGLGADASPRLIELTAKITF